MKAITVLLTSLLAVLLILSLNVLLPSSSSMGAENRVPYPMARTLRPAHIDERVDIVPTFSALSDSDRRDLGQRDYRRSCVHCHGITPQALPYQNAERFLRVVMDGGNDMPALGFKLTVGEVEAMRLYIAGCATDTVSC